MLEQAHITQTQAGPSRLTREVVPTSDDEDVFFVSQSSDKIGSSLDSARSLRQNSRSIPNGGDDDDEDHELTLPVRHASALRSQSYSSDPSTEVSAPLTALTTDPTANTPRDRRAPATSAPSVSTAPLRSRSESPPLRSISVETGCILSQPTGDGRDRPVERNSTAKQDVIAPDEAVDITIRRQGRSRRESQQSHTTLSLAESLVVSRQSTPLSNPTLHSNSGLFPGDAPRTDAPTTLPIPINLEDDYVSGHEAQSYKTGEERDDQASHRLPTLSPTPEIPSLCNSGRDAAPQPPPPIPHQALGTASHFNDNPIIEDERIARAAAAQPPTPPRRQLRARNAAQLNPYTLEAIRYQRALIRNDWQDAVVSQREWHRQERKRLAEEAARAQREVQGAHGSEESQSQWLIPSSEPNSPADHEQLSALSSPPVSVLPRVAAEVSALEIDSISPRGNARQSSPSPSQSDRLPELAEMLAKKSKSASRQTDLDPSRHTTYKGSRTMAEEYEHSQSRQEKGPDFHRADEDDVIPLPAPARRKAPLRALSPSDSEAAMGAGERGPTNCDASIVDSSEDERPQPLPVITKPKRRSRWSGDGSSSDSTDYERRFRQLKKMMPAGMARKHIRDLRAMRHGKAYHSDGHVSSSSSGNAADNGSARRHTERAQAESAETIEISDDQDLQPGQTRKRLRRHDSLDGSNALLIEPDSDLSSSSASSVSSLSPGPTTAQLPIDENISNGNKEAEEVDDSPAPWWSANPLDSYVPYRERDAIDRMLSRTGGRKPSSKSTVHRRKSVSQHRQARLDGFVSAHRLRERATGSSRSHLREIDQNERLDQGITIDVSNKDAQQLPKRKKKRRKTDPRVGRATNYSTARGPTVLRNPPLVRPRVRPRLDLDQHDVLFAANPTRARFAPQGIKIDHVSGDEDASDDDGEWQVLSCVVKDSTLVPLPDARLAVPRTRATVGARQVSSLSTTNEAVSSPIRGLRTSPSASSNSAGLARLHAVNDRSPGTPTRPRLGKSLQTVQVRASTSHNPNLAKAAVSDVGANDVWDDFEGISLDFGMHPFTDGQKLNAEGSSLLARLPDLLALSDRLLHREHIPRIWFGDVLRLEETTLDIDMDHDTLASRLPFFVDNLRLRVGRSLGEGQDGSGADARRYARNLIADTGVFLGCWMVRQAQRAENGRTDFASIFRSYRTILERLEQLQASALSLHDSTHSSKACREDRKRICLQLAWMRFELCWRAMAICDSDINNALEPDAPTVESLLSYGRTLMALLLHHGLHRSIRNVRKAAMTGCSTTDIHTSSLNMVLDDDVAQSIDDTTAMWLGVIHAFSSLEHSRGIVDGRLFWTQFEVAFQRWDESMPKRAPLLRSESLWYCLFALGSLSQVSANGQTQATPSLRECWPLVARALSYIVFRSDESKEMAMGWHILAKRDAYVRIILQRCCLLVSEWRWTMQGAEVTLARLFDIFNSHKLADLPTETEHDFVAFLRDFDVEKLSIADVADREATQDPSFHLFVRLLARAGQELREHALDPKDGDRRISRLFSRMTPVRVMPFTRSDVPTSSQRSVLFNHYTVVMLFLHFVPTSSPQRLRQIQSFLPAFKDADFVSQVTCIRAMMYVAVIFRHHRLDLCPVTKWFGETISALRREYEEIESTTNQYERHQLQQQSLRQRGAQASSRADAIRMAAIFEHAPARQAALRRKEEVTRLLVVALRSVQHVIRREDLCGDNHGVQTSDQRLPDQLLLSPAWTQQMLEAQISLEPRVGQEVLKCIQTFLLARMRVLQPALTTEDQANTNHADANDVESATLQQKQHMQQARDEESQDSFAELFEADDDFDFEDPLLARLLDGADGSTACDARGTRLETQASEAVSAAAAAAALEKKRWDREFGELIKSTISPSLFQLLSNIYHPDRRMEAAVTGSVDMSLGVTQRLDELPEGGNGANGGSRSRMDRLLKTAQARQFLELVVDCWAGCAQVLVTNGLREWSSYLGFGNESWKRIDDASGRRDVGLRFLQNVLTLDAAAVQRREYEVEFLAVWIQTAVARVLSVQDVYTRSLMEVAKKVKRVPNTLLPLLAVEWRSIISGSSATGERQDAPVGEDAQAELHSLDLDSFTQHRQALLRAMYTVLGSTLANKTTSIGTAYSILSALLSAIRAYVDDTHLDSSSSSSGTSSSSSPLAYLSFCRSTLDDLHAALAASGVISLLHAEYAAAIARLSAKLDNSHNIESEA